MKQIWSPLAIGRVNEIAERIAEERPLAAEKWTEEIFDRVKLLEKSQRAVARSRRCGTGRTGARSFTEISASSTG